MEVDTLVATTAGREPSSTSTSTSTSGESTRSEAVTVTATVTGAPLDQEGVVDMEVDQPEEIGTAGKYVNKEKEIKEGSGLELEGGGGGAGAQKAVPVPVSRVLATQRELFREYLQSATRSMARGQRDQKQGQQGRQQDQDQDQGGEVPADLLYRAVSLELHLCTRYTE